MSPLFTRRHFNALAVGAAASLTAGVKVLPAWADEAVDVSWSSDIPHLGGNFLPVQRETSAEDLKVISGRIPPELSGVYMRNGPNPLFKPIAYAYPMDGDGMIHAVYLEGGRARYRNRFVRTRDLSVERRVGHAVYGSFTRPTPIDPKLLLAGDNPGPYKNGAFINIIRHGGRLIALNEATTSYEMSMELETLGQWTAGIGQPLQLGAHNRHHPRTGDMIALQYTWREPTVHFHQIDKAGKLVNSIPVPMAMPTMVHDFILTERYIVLIAGPAVFDVEAARGGQSMLQWRPSMGMRIAVIPLDGGTIRWIEGDPFFVYHFGNGFGVPLISVPKVPVFSLGNSSG
jgi:carotenoid cleavage dioxygenase-like enzyme